MTDEAAIREGFESGRLHPSTLLEHEVRAGNMERARLISEIGPHYLRGGQRVAFAAQVRRHFPPDEAQEKQRLAEARAERTDGIGSALQARVNHRRDRKRARDYKPSIGWNVPPKEGVEYRSPDSWSWNTPPKS